MITIDAETEILNLVKQHYAERPKIVAMFERCLTSSLDDTVTFHAEDDTAFLITGDIPAMWLRDSTNQLRPFLYFAKPGDEQTKMILAVLKKQLQCIMLDPYANAFNDDANGNGHQDDQTVMKPEIWERKYEVDSLCYPLQLSYLIWRNIGVTTQFDTLFLDVVKQVVTVWETEQDHGQNSTYRFERNNGVATDTLTHGGVGAPVAVTGMTWSGFRPSDDACDYGYLVPANMFAVVVLDYVDTILTTFYPDELVLQRRAHHLKEAIDSGIRHFGRVNDETYGEIYAYEVDGLGNSNLMDDANVPSLLAVPYLGYQAAPAVYQNTRRFILSRKNPYYYDGLYSAGIGSPHTPENYIWHIALAIQGLTSDDPKEIQRLLQYFETTDAGTNLVHEGFDKDDPRHYTREWFGWANALFMEFVLSTIGIRLKD